MALNIKNAEVERLASEVSRLTGESKTEAIRKALEDRRERLRRRGANERRVTEMRSWLEREVWSKLPRAVRGKPVTKEEREKILGYGPEGV